MCAVKENKQTCIHNQETDCVCTEKQLDGDKLKQARQPGHSKFEHLSVRFSSYATNFNRFKNDPGRVRSKQIGKTTLSRFRTSNRSHIMLLTTERQRCVQQLHEHRKCCQNDNVIANTQASAFSNTKKYNKMC